MVNAARNNHIEAVRAMIQANVTLEHKAYAWDRCTPLHFAAQEGHIEIVQALLAAKAEVDTTGYIRPSRIVTHSSSPVLTFSPFNPLHSLTLHLLLSSSHPRPLSMPLSPTHLLAVTLLHSHCLLLHTPAHTTFCSLQQLCVLCMHSGRYDDDTQSDYVHTPLLRAAEKGHVAVVAALLTAGADTTVEDDWRSTPLHLAADEGLASMVRDLLAADAKADAQDNDGSAPLHLAAQCGHVDSVKLLLEVSAAVDCRNNNGQTPMHLAARCQDYSKGAATVIALLEANAVGDSIDDAGVSPLDVAEEYNNTIVVELLLDGK